jgi:hypothetical protein
MTERTIPNTATVSGWRRSSHSDSDAGSCLEVLDGHPSGVPVRDSKCTDGPALIFPASDWSAFVSAVKGGDLPA